MEEKKDDDRKVVLNTRERAVVLHMFDKTLISFQLETARNAG